MTKHKNTTAVSEQQGAIGSHTVTRQGRTFQYRFGSNKELPKDEKGRSKPQGGRVAMADKDGKREIVVRVPVDVDEYLYPTEQGDPMLATFGFQRVVVDGSDPDKARVLILNCWLKEDLAQTAELRQAIKDGRNVDDKGRATESAELAQLRRQNEMLLKLMGTIAGKMGLGADDLKDLLG